MKNINNPFEALERTIAFDVSDWGADRRRALKSLNIILGGVTKI